MVRSNGDESDFFRFIRESKWYAVTGWVSFCKVLLENPMVRSNGDGSVIL